MIEAKIFLWLTLLLSFSTLLSNDKNKKEKKKANHLKNETSPYLLQHVYNPVDWYPWGKEAFDKAKKEKKPIFLSVGYSSCHWCHVMEKESFENEKIAKYLNDNFISIKVDREERPDVDTIYMEFVRVSTGGGGWPMTVFLNTELKPFFGGTYFPADEKYGKQSFKNILELIAKVWKEQPDEIKRITKQAQKGLQQNLHIQGLDVVKINKDHIHKTIGFIEKSFDSVYGGFGKQPKFPNSNMMRYLIRQVHFKKSESAKKMLVKTLDEMSEGGIYDHIGGGFHRYSVDREWLVPHFEKMLYDNGQLAVVYLEAYQLLGYERYKDVATEILDYQIRKMTNNEDGGFYASEDADSEGKEGEFFVWEYEEVKKLLSDEEFKIATDLFSIKKEGNFESHESYHKNKNIFHLLTSYEEYAKTKKMKLSDLKKQVKSMKEKLLAVRIKRVHPGKDDKVIASWNGLMITAMARGYQVLQDKKYYTAAINTGNFIKNNMMKDGTLLKTYRSNIAKIDGVLDDYALLIDAYITLYEISFDESWIDEAIKLHNILEKEFKDDAGGYFYTGKSQKNLIVRTKPSSDNVIPSGNNVQANNLLKLWKLTNNEEYFKLAEKILKQGSLFIEKYPLSNLKLLEAWSFYLEKSYEIAIVGEGDPQDNEFILESYKKYIPNRVIAYSKIAGKSKYKGKIKLLENKTLLGKKSTAYVCQNFVCHLPVTTKKEFLKNFEAVK
ncbi:MAG: thioredoxin domain-containing protein [Planctomycetota bacterium]|nr:MAG: thioredoxin domain-containing protein [Planctomycetota bacterium]